MARRRKRRKKADAKTKPDATTKKKKIAKVDAPEEETATEESEIDAANEEASEVEDVANTDEVDDKAEEVDIEKELAETKEKYLRARAELDNLRKRKTKEIDDARRNGRIYTLEEIMPAMDQFQMAVSHIDAASDIETMKVGMKMIQTTFEHCFENLGVEHIPTVGEKFDPNLHEAVSMEHSDEVEVDHIIREWKAGYKLGDYLLRAPSVVVSKGPAGEDDGDEEDDADKPDEPEADADAEDVVD